MLRVLCNAIVRKVRHCNRDSQKDTAPGIHFVKFQLPLLDTTISMGETFVHFDTYKTLFNLKPELHHRMLAQQWLTLQLFLLFEHPSWIMPFHSKAPTHEIILCRDFSTNLLFFFQSQRQLQLVCLLPVREVTSISSEIQDAYYNTAFFFQPTPNQSSAGKISNVLWFGLRSTEVHSQKM